MRFNFFAFELLRRSKVGFGFGKIGLFNLPLHVTNTIFVNITYDRPFINPSHREQSAQSSPPVTSPVMSKEIPLTGLTFDNTPLIRFMKVVVGVVELTLLSSTKPFAHIASAARHHIAANAGNMLTEYEIIPITHFNKLVGFSPISLIYELCFILFNALPISRHRPQVSLIIVGKSSTNEPCSAFIIPNCGTIIPTRTFKQTCQRFPRAFDRWSGCCKKALIGSTEEHIKPSIMVSQ